MTGVDVEMLPPPPRSPELHDLLAAIERAMHLQVSRELARVEASVGALFAELEARLADADALADALREENATLTRENARYEHAFETLRELWRDDP